MKPKLEYVFSAERTDGTLANREYETFPNVGSPYTSLVELAAQIAARRYGPGETGIRVTFLGWREVDKPLEDVVPMNRFTLTVQRTT